MKKKAVKKTKSKPLKGKLIAAVHKVFKANKSDLTAKIQKVINKSVNKIVKNTDKEIKKALKAK
jgi:hypothetical protein